MTRSPYAGRRPDTASVPQIEVKRLAARYKQLQNLSQCAREFGISRRRCKALLEGADVPEQAGQEAAVDEDVLLRAYDYLGSVAVVAKLRDVPEDKVREILARHQVRRAPHGELPPSSGRGIARQIARSGDLPSGSPDAPERSPVR